MTRQIIGITKRKKTIMGYLMLLGVGLFSLLAGLSCSAWRDQHQAGGRRGEPSPPLIINTYIDSLGLPLSMHFEKGKAFNHPLMAIWIEDVDHQYIQTVYIAESIGKGIFRHGDSSGGRWMPGPIRRPAALPYWGHQRGIQASDGLYLPTQDDPMPDAISGPTPKGHFILNTQTPANMPDTFRVLLEINQSWDWNAYWTNDKYPGDREYMTSSQPALVYEAVVSLSDGESEFPMRPIGHSHWSGQSGELFEDLSTLTTAFDIAASIVVRIR